MRRLRRSTCVRAQSDGHSAAFPGLRARYYWGGASTFLAPNNLGRQHATTKSWPALAFAFSRAHRSAFSIHAI